LATEVIMPALGMAQETGRIVRWLKAEGEEVQAGEPLLEVETDKSVVELEAPATGALRILVASSEEAVPVGKVVGWIAAPGEVLPEAASPSVSASAARPAPSVVQPSAPSPTPRRGRPLLSPAARRVARELGLDLSELPEGSRPLHVADVRRLAEAKAKAPASAEPLVAAATDEGAFSRYTGVQEVMAQRTAQSWRQAPHFYLMRQVRAQGLEGWLYAARRHEEETTFTDLLIVACARVLAEFPELNATAVPGGVRRHEGVHVGIAVATERGLVVPVVHDAARRTLRSVTEERRALVARARQGQLSPEDVRGGTFTISNLGMFGVDRFLPVLNLDQALLLAVGRIRREPVAEGDAVVVRSVVDLTLACDHRVADGAAAARFLEHLAAALEDPTLLIA
jgi:pyruvate dehydrogenase E2 component (dihydrolipoamide acetyltransferase)